MSKLCIPQEVLAQHVVVLGKTGAGKSSALRHIVEHLLDKGKRVVIIDPKGDWWGLKSSADGKAAGYAVVAFGNFKDERASDVPINDQSGKHVAELVATGNRPCIIGFRGWMPSAMTRFWVDFASTLFNANTDELYLVVDEVHNFCPKGKVMNPDVGNSIHWTNRLLAEGRGLGIVALIASQRPQKVHNDTLTSCETLIAMRVIHKADRQALKDWIDGCGDGTTGNDLLANIAGLPRGQGYVWSPEIGYGPVLVKFPMFETFDSFAPAKLQKKVNTSTWADVDLGAVKDKLASVIEEAKANDPKALRATIADLRRQLAKPSFAAEKFTTITVPILTEEQVRLIQAAIGTIGLMRSELAKLEQTSEGMKIEFSNLAGVVAKQGQTGKPVTPPRPRHPDLRPNGIKPVARVTPIAVSDGSLELTPALRKVLAVLAQHSGCQSGKLALLSGYSYSGGFRNLLASLRSAGYIVGGNDGVMQITTAGEAALGEFDPLPTGAALAEFWLNNPRLSPAARKVLRVLVNNPDGFTGTDLAAACEPPYEFSGGFRNILSTLRTAGVIVGKNGETITAAAELFD